MQSDMDRSRVKSDVGVRGHKRAKRGSENKSILTLLLEAEDTVVEIGGLEKTRATME